MHKYQEKAGDKESKENKPARPYSADNRNRQPNAAIKGAGRPESANDANRAPAANPVSLAWNAAKQGQADRWVKKKGLGCASSNKKMCKSSVTVTEQNYGKSSGEREVLTHQRLSRATCARILYRARREVACLGDRCLKNLSTRSID